MKLFSGLSIVAMILGLGIAANATTILYVDVQELARTADLVFDGVVQDVRVVEGKNKGDIKTQVTFAVKSVYKGTWAGPQFTLTMPGGKGSKYIMAIPGMPKFRKHEEVVLFLEQTPKGFTVSGLSEGKFEVHQDLHGKKMATRDLSGVMMVKKDPDTGRIVPKGAGGKESFTLDELVKAINHGINAQVME